MNYKLQSLTLSVLFLGVGKLGNIDISAMNTKLILFTLFLSPFISGLSAATESMRPYTIQFPGSVLRYSLPDVVAKSIPPIVQVKQLSRFDPTDKSFIAHGYLEIAGTLHDFNGPFWVGAYGSLKFHFIVQKRSSNFTGEINSLDGLDRYIRWWTHEANPSYSFDFSRAMIMNSQWLVRSHYDFSQSAINKGEQREELEILSMPIDNEMFLDVGFIITEWIPGSAEKWKLIAEKLREEIKSTLVFGVNRAGPTNAR